MPQSPWDVALIIAAFNAESTLSETLDSVVAQTYFDRIHTIVVDNNSTDDTGAIAAQYAAKYPNISLTHRVGGGCGGARNTGLAFSREPFVTFLDADDLLMPQSVERRFELMQSSGADVVLGAMETFPDVRPYTPMAVYGEDRVVEGLDEDRRLVHVANVTAVLFTRDFFDDPANLFFEDLPFEDVAVTCAALAGASRIAISSYPGYRYRKDPTAATIMSTAHTRPGNYRDHLWINTTVHARHRDDPIATEAIGHMMIRSLLPYLQRAPQILNDDELRSFVSGARDLYSQYPTAQILEHAPLLAQSLVYYAAATGDVDLLRDPQSHIAGFEVIDDVAHVRLDRPTVDQFRQLLQVQHNARRWGIGTAAVTLDEAAATSDGRITVRGTIEHVSAGVVHVPMPAFNFGLQIGSTGSAVPVTMSPGATSTAWQWTSTIDPRDLEVGPYRLSLIADPWSPQDRYPILTPAALTPLPHIRIRPGKTGRRTVLAIRPTRL